MLSNVIYNIIFVCIYGKRLLSNNLFLFPFRTTFKPLLDTRFLWLGVSDIINVEIRRIIALYMRNHERKIKLLLKLLL